MLRAAQQRFADSLFRTCPRRSGLTEFEPIRGQATRLVRGKSEGGGAKSSRYFLVVQGPDPEFTNL